MLRLLLLCSVLVPLSLPAQQPAGKGKPGFSHGLPTDPDWFPLAVWLQSPHNAGRFREVGVNLYVGQFGGPTEAQLEALKQAGMPVICSQNEVALKHKDDATIVGWMHGDEPDNAQEQAGGGFGPPIPPARIVADYKELQRRDPTRPVLLNLGQGVAWDGWFGRGARTNHPEDYPEYVVGCDIASFDIYPVTHSHGDVKGRLEFVGNGVQRLLKWSGRKPVWACIETTHISNQQALPTPAQLRSEVWMAIANGASGIIYFVHEFQPKFVEAGVFEHPELAAAMKDVNAEVLGLALVLNQPSAPKAAKASGEVALLCKQHKGALYLFAVSMSGTAQQVKVTLTGKQKAAVEVLGEARKLQASGGGFEDAFAPYAVHLYRLKA